MADQEVAKRAGPSKPIINVETPGPGHEYVLVGSDPGSSITEMLTTMDGSELPIPVPVPMRAVAVAASWQSDNAPSGDWTATLMRKVPGGDWVETVTFSITTS